MENQGASETETEKEGKREKELIKVCLFIVTRVKKLRVSNGSTEIIVCISDYLTVREKDLPW